ncbi:unnamed protein product [Effrenium voratum]|nr:unnamed protein product [Effrenium voratum]
MALQVNAWGGKVVTMEMDPVNATHGVDLDQSRRAEATIAAQNASPDGSLARNHIEMAGLSQAVTVQLGHSDDALQLVKERYGEQSLDMVFMDQRGTAFHEDLRTLEQLNLLAENAVVVADNVLKPGAPYHVWRISTLPHYATDIIDLREFGSAPVEDWMTVSWVRRTGPSYGQLPREVRELNELARESDRFRLKAMATSMKDLVGDPLDDFAKKFTDEFIKLGIRTSMYVRTEVVDGCAVSRLVRLAEGESPPKWDGEDPRDEIKGGQWRGVIGGTFACEGKFMPGHRQIAPGSHNFLTPELWVALPKVCEVQAQKDWTLRPEIDSPAERKQVKAAIEAQSGIPSKSQQLLHQRSHPFSTLLTPMASLCRRWISAQSPAPAGRRLRVLHWTNVLADCLAKSSSLLSLTRGFRCEEQVLRWEVRRQKVLEESFCGMSPTSWACARWTTSKISSSPSSRQRAIRAPSSASGAQPKTGSAPFGAAGSSRKGCAAASFWSMEGIAPRRRRSRCCSACGRRTGSKARAWWSAPPTCGPPRMRASACSRPRRWYRLLLTLPVGTSKSSWPT